MAGGKRNAVGGFAARSGERFGFHFRHGYQRRRHRVDYRRSGWNAGGAERGQDFYRYEHGEPNRQPRAGLEGTRKRRGHGGLAGFRQRDYLAGRQAFGDGRRSSRDFRKSEAAAARYWSEGDLRRRQRFGAGDEDCG